METATRPQSEATAKQGENAAARKKPEGTGKSPVNGLKESSGQNRADQKATGGAYQAEKAKAVSDAANGRKNAEGQARKDSSIRPPEKSQSPKGENRISKNAEGAATKDAPTVRQADKPKSAAEGGVRKDTSSSVSPEKKTPSSSEAPLGKKSTTEGGAPASQQLEKSKPPAERASGQANPEKSAPKDVARPQQIQKPEVTAQQPKENRDAKAHSQSDRTAPRPSEANKSKAEVVREQKNDSHLHSEAAAEKKSDQKAAVQEGPQKKRGSEDNVRLDKSASSQEDRSKVTANDKRDELKADNARQKENDTATTDKKDSSTERIATTHQRELADHSLQNADNKEHTAQEKEYALDEQRQADAESTRTEETRPEQHRLEELTHDTQKEEEAAAEQLREEGDRREAQRELESRAIDDNDTLAQAQEQRQDREREQTNGEQKCQQQAADVAQRTARDQQEAERAAAASSLLAGQKESSDRAAGIHSSESAPQESSSQPLHGLEATTQQESTIRREQSAHSASLANQSDGIAAKAAEAEAVRNFKQASISDLPVTHLMERPNGETQLELEEQSEITDRQAEALDFYATANVDDVRQELDGIDFTAEVKEVKFPTGSVFIQHQYPERSTGRYFALVGTPAESLGVSALGREMRVYVALEEVTMLQSRARSTDRDSRMPPNYRGRGGGTQFFVRDQSQFLLLKEKL